MALYPLTSYEYRYRITGSSWTSWITCNTSNSRIEGTRVIVYVPNENIAIGDFQVRVRQLGINPAGAILSSTEAFVEVYPVDFDYYVSNSGNDSNNGLTQLTPKLTFAAVKSIMTDGQSVGLRAGDEFNESIDIKGIIGAYDFDETKPAAKVTNSGLVNSGWTLVGGTSNVWQQQFASGYPGNGYNNNYIIEVTKANEAAQPFSSWKYLKAVATQEELESTPGSFRIVDQSALPVTLQLHPSNSASPNSNALYSYRRPVRRYGLSSNGFAFRIISSDAIDGYGPSSGQGKIKKSVFRGGSTHTMVVAPVRLESVAILNNFRDGADGQITLTFYRANVEGESCYVKDLRMFDPDSAVLSHNSAIGNSGEEINVKRMEVWGDSNFPVEISFNIASFKRGVLDEYFTHWNGILYRGSSEGYTVTNSMGLNCTFSICNFMPFISDRNSFYQLVGHPAPYGLTGYSASKYDIQNCILYAKAASGGFRAFTYNPEPTGPANICKYNIIIGDFATGETTFNECILNVNGAGSLIKGSANRLESDYNVYIKVTNHATNFIVKNRSVGSPSSFDDWKEWTGQDQHSLFIDLSSEPSGLDKIFVDPDNGDWTFTSDALALQIQALGAGMLTPPSSYPVRPTFEQAASDALNGVPLPSKF